DGHHPDATGLSLRAENNVDGVRMSTALTYLQPSRHRLNLTIRSQVMVRRILFAGTTATGVEVDSGGGGFFLESQEVVLSAGAVASPPLLLLSRAGPPASLPPPGLPVGYPLPPAGPTMSDHP